MASTDAAPVPRKNTAFRITFAMRLNTGGLNSGAAGLDSQISKDGAAFVACTNEATEIANGIYYLDLTATEMNAQTVAVIVRSSTSGAVTPDFTLYPAIETSIPANIKALNDSIPAAQLQSTLLAAGSLPGTVDSATYAPTTIDFETSLVASVATDFYKGRSLIFTSGALQFQATRISGSTYTGNNKVKLTVNTLTAAPISGAQFCII